jgi:hypothetical protein
MNKLSQLALLSLFAFSLAAQDKPGAHEIKKPAPPELTTNEMRQVERFSDLYGELGQQMMEAQTKLKVIQEMQQKLVADFNGFQAAVIDARGYKPGEAVLDLQQRKVTQVPSNANAAAAPAPGK